MCQFFQPTPGIVPADLIVVDKSKVNSEEISDPVHVNHPYSYPHALPAIWQVSLLMTRNVPLVSKGTVVRLIPYKPMPSHPDSPFIWIPDKTVYDRYLTNDKMALGITDDAYLVPGSQTVMVHVQTCTDEQCQIHEVLLTTVRAEFDQVWLKAVDVSRAQLSQCGVERLPPPPEWVTRHMAKLEEWEHHHLSSRASSNDTIRPSSSQPASQSMQTLGCGTAKSSTLSAPTQPHAPQGTDQGLMSGRSSSTVKLQFHHATPVFDQPRTESPLFGMDWTDPFCANMSTISFSRGADPSPLDQPSPLVPDIHATRGRISMRSPILGRIVKAKRSLVNLLARPRASAV